MTTDYDILPDSIYNYYPKIIGDQFNPGVILDETSNMGNPVSSTMAFDPKIQTLAETDSSTNLAKTMEQIEQSKKQGDLYRKQSNVPQMSWNLGKMFNSTASDDPHIYRQSHFGRFNPDIMGAEYDEPDKTYQSEDRIIHGLANYPSL